MTKLNLFDLIENNDVERVKWWFENNEVTEIYKKMALVTAVRNSEKEMVELLLNFDCKPIFKCFFVNIFPNYRIINQPIS